MRAPKLVGRGSKAPLKKKSVLQGSPKRECMLQRDLSGALADRVPKGAHFIYVEILTDQRAVSNASHGFIYFLPVGVQPQGEIRTLESTFGGPYNLRRKKRLHCPPHQ